MLAGAARPQRPFAFLAIKLALSDDASKIFYLVQTLVIQLSKISSQLPYKNYAKLSRSSQLSKLYDLIILIGPHCIVVCNFLAQQILLPILNLCTSNMNCALAHKLLLLYYN